MFYLVSFLTLLISVLVYMMDPAPVQLRRDLDVQTAEAYIVGFVNQHQAARDYLNQWLGRVDPTLPNVQKLNGNNTTTMARDTGAVALALPAEMEESLPISQKIERGTIMNADDPDGNGYLDFNSFSNNNAGGSYLSALVCLDNSGNMRPCYSYRCFDNATPPAIALTAPGVDCGVNQTMVGVEFANNITPYVVTYSNNPVDPVWWDNKGNPRALRHELWRRALANRTHASYFCGVISGAKDVCEAGNNAHYRRLGRGRIIWEAGNANGAGEATYCINNGNRCMNLLPSGMQTFLETVVSEQCSDNNNAKNLAGVLFCMSEVNDPYPVQPVWNFDGIDNMAMGANSRTDSLNWTAQKSGRIVNFVDGAWGRQRNGNDEFKQFAFVNHTDGITMPFNHMKNDFTLNVIAHVNDGNPGWIIGSDQDDEDAGTITPGGGYALHYDGGSGNSAEVTFYYNQVGGQETIVSLRGDAVGRAPHSWTVVRRGADIELYLDGVQVRKDTAPDVPPDTNPASEGVPVVVGRQSMGIGSVRYYTNALFPTEIKNMFKVDSRRYGTHKLTID